MAFIIIAPGLRDVLPTPETFENRPLNETLKTTPLHPAPSPESEHQPTEQQMRNLNQEHAQHRYEETAEVTHLRTPALLAEQIMSRPVITLGPDTTVRRAWQIFRDHHFRHLPVVAKEGHLQGIISERDLLLDAAGFGAAGTTAHVTIRPLLIARVLSATADTEIRDIARVLFEQHISAIPIINSSDRPIGIVTRSDILQAIIKNAPLEMWA
ncbi:MAG: CBS domain-containing protein [Candidatus Polarisedimenticolaceae bacterium]|nr:CBS domain-containing protein [Candidatus Polarisedimenticolaceae bacterium]